ncbi:MAG TPA: outer membrane beta-barrel protein [Pseudolabrys sp.]|nr:outer membrane beta-barrel protein [Pseudolabrys sp.]
MTGTLAKAGLAALAMLAMLGAAEAGERKPRRTTDPTPVGEWTGFYIGGNLGYGAAGLTDDAPLAITSNMTGVIGGVQAGYNYQIDRVVLGIEGDIQASGQSTSYTRTLPVVGNFTISQRIPYFETLRGRIGYAFDCGCVMAYGTIGIAYGAYEPSASALGATVSGHYTRSALAVGAGVEWMVTKGWSAKLEGLYLDTGNIGSPANLPGIGEVHMRVRDAIMRLGLNYHF